MVGRGIEKEFPEMVRTLHCCGFDTKKILHESLVLKALQSIAEMCQMRNKDC